MPSLAPEHELLVLLARTRGAEAHRERARELVGRGVDWAGALMAALDHGVMPLLHRNFFVLGPGAAPDSFVRDLRALYLANEYRNLSLTSELVRMLGAFDAGGVPVVAYGGPLLAAAGYGDVALRQTSRLDVLVGHADLGRAAALLAGAGYVLRDRLTPRQAREEARNDGRLAFALADPDVALDLHVRFAPLSLAGAPDPRLALENRRREPFGGTVVPSLDPDDALLVLAVEGTLAGWRKLVTVCDAAELLASRNAWEWPGLLDRARSEGSLRMLLLAVSLAARVLAAPVPAEVLALADRKPDVVELRRRVVDRLFDPTGTPRSRIAALSFESRALDRARSRFAHAWRRALVPAADDWRWLRLPDALYPLYYAVRPVRLAWVGLTAARARRR